MQLFLNKSKAAYIAEFMSRSLLFIPSDVIAYIEWLYEAIKSRSDGQYVNFYIYCV